MVTTLSTPVLVTCGVHRVPENASYLAVAVLQAVQSDALPDDCPG